MNDVLTPENHHPRNVMIALLIFFAALTGARLNHLYFFAPDSADYVVMARGLVNDFEYRKTDAPGEPYFTVRPPGMSVLLIPAALIAPYNAVLAKVTVIITGIVTLFLMYLWMCRLEISATEAFPDTKSALTWLALFVILLFASNPYILLFSTIIMSEIPFMAFTLAILYLISHDEEKIGKRNLVLLTCLLTFLPLVRTIGITLALALGIWAVTKRKRWPYLIGVAGACATTVIWTMRNNAYKTDVYTSATIDEIKSMGVIGTLLTMMNRTLNHFEGFCQKLFPNMPGETPRYERFVLDGNHVLPGPQAIYSLASIFVISIAVYGMLKCWKKGGAVSLLYLGLTFGILSVWPWMQPRYTLPLLPVVLAFLPVGLVLLGKRLAGINDFSKKCIAGLLLLSGIALLISQTKIDYSIIITNQQLLSKGDQFYQTQFPASHFSNFVEAGKWIKQHSSPEARLLTNRNEVATTAHRYQKAVRFEQQKPDRLHEYIQHYSARYLVCHDKNVVIAFPWYLLDNDLIYRLNPVYEKSGVMIVEIQPNYEGTIRHQYYREEESMEIARKVLQRFPHRLSAQIAYIGQLLEQNKNDEVISFIQEQDEVNDVQIVNLLGWAYVGKRQYQQALEQFVRALHMPGNKPIRNSILQGASISQKKLEQEKEPGESDPSENPQAYLRLAQEYWKLASFKNVHQFAQKVFDSDKASQAELAQAHVLLARLHLINGRTSQAVEELKLVQDTENQEAQSLREMIQLETSLETLLLNRNKTDEKTRQPLDQQQQASILKLVSLYKAEGVPGKALKLLMQAHASAPENDPILKSLAESQLFYNQVPEAEANYLRLQKTTPDDPEIQAALEKIEELKKTPRF
tara:strand:- start:33471 stop:36050 length:2580 start_codon:yes stop_codon:yes gene_type:complete